MYNHLYNWTVWTTGDGDTHPFAGLSNRPGHDHERAMGHAQPTRVPFTEAQVRAIVRQELAGLISVDVPDAPPKNL